MLRKKIKYDNIFRIFSFILFGAATINLLFFINKFESLNNNFIDISILGWLAGGIIIDTISRPLKRFISIDIVISVFFIIKIITLILSATIRSGPISYSWHYALIVFLSFLVYIPVIINVYRYWDFYVED